MAPVTCAGTAGRPLLLAAVLLASLLPTALAARHQMLRSLKQAETGPVTRNYDLVLTYITAAPDGIARQVIAVNGKFPSPPIEMVEGDRLIARVVNNLNTTTSIHWHGFTHRDGTCNMDGVPGITQLLIQPGETKVYNFTSDLAGSYWYHAHNSVQYVNGLRGPLIVHERNAKPIRDDLTLMLGDWYHRQSQDLLVNQFLVPESEGAEPVPDSALFNGIGQLGCRNALSSGNPAFSKNPDCKYARLVAQRGGTCDSPTIRLRLINSAAFAAFNITVDGHRMRIIAADATPIEPVNVGHIRINPGQRYDALLCRTDGGYGEGAFWIRGWMDQDVFDSPGKHVQVLGILQYTKNPDIIPTTTYNYQGYGLGGRYTEQGFQLDPNSLSTALPGALPAPRPTVNITTDIIFRPEPSGPLAGVTLGTFDNVPWALMPANMNETVLQRLERGDPNPFPAGAPHRYFNLTDVVMLVLNNEDDGQHPIHLHGGRFYVLAQGKPDAGKFDPATDKLNFVNPLLRDTATIAATSWMAILFRADNPGVWLFHCHIDWHMSGGLAEAFVFGLRP